jgi:hypothetical protein
MASAGYSGTPLAKKLGIASGSRVLARNAPDDYLELLSPLPEAVVFARRLSAQTDLVHLFVRGRSTLSAELQALRRALRADATLWVSWPKKASKQPTDIDEQAIRDLALPLGFVDVKVCAIDATWSGLKLVVRKELR